MAVLGHHNHEADHSWQRRLRQVERVVVAFLVGGVVALAGPACDVHVSSNLHDSAGDCRPMSYDLSRPPSRADVGMDPGEGYADASCDAGFPLRLTLPEGTTTSLTASQVSADSYSAVDPGTNPPTTMDVHSVALDLDQAVRTSTRLANDLGIDPSALATWRQQVADSRSTDSVDSPFLRNRVGYLTVEIQVQHLGISGNNYLHLILGWG